MSLEEMKKEFLKIKTKGQSEGLTIKDYVSLRDMRDKIGISIEDNIFSHDYLNNELFSSVEELYAKGMRGLLSYDDYLDFKEKFDELTPKIVSYFSSQDNEEFQNNLFGDMSEVIDQIYRSGLLNKFSSKDCKYIAHNSLLLSLVLANNEHPKIKITGDNRYMFLCQLHLENTPSLGVYDLTNTMFCYGCGVVAGPVSYLKRCEGLSFPQTLQLLSQIYLFDVGKVNSKFDPLVEKYQAALLSDEYKVLLEMGRNRLKERQIDEINGKSIDSLYEFRYETIDRIKNGQYDSNFSYEGPKKLVYLNYKK